MGWRTEVRYPATSTGTLPPPPSYYQQEMVMRAHLANVPLAVWAVLGIPALIVSRCVVLTIVPHVVQAVVPQVLRTVLRVI